MKIGEIPGRAKEIFAPSKTKVAVVLTVLGTISILMGTTDAHNRSDKIVERINGQAFDKNGNNVDVLNTLDDIAIFGGAGAILTGGIYLCAKGFKRHGDNEINIAN